jgi:hypothetical protein
MLCKQCGTREDRPCSHVQMTREYYRVLIRPLRHVAHRYGYAIGVHGSLKRDIDLIAAPWRISPSSAASLIEGLREAAEKIIGFAEIREETRYPERKPGGRLAWSIYLVPRECDGPYLDISVLPRVEETTPADV